MDEEKVEHVAQHAFAALLSNPSVIAPDCMCGWRLQNCTPAQLADYAWYLAREFVHAGGTSAGRQPYVDATNTTAPVIVPRPG